MADNFCVGQFRTEEVIGSGDLAALVPAIKRVRTDV